MSEQGTTKDQLYHCCECDKMLPLCDFRVFNGQRKGYCMCCEPKYQQRYRGAKKEERAIRNAAMRKAEGASPFASWGISRKTRAARKRKQAVQP